MLNINGTYGQYKIKDNVTLKTMLVKYKFTVPLHHYFIYVSLKTMLVKYKYHFQEMVLLCVWTLKTMFVKYKCQSFNSFPVILGFFKNNAC